MAKQTKSLSQIITGTTMAKRYKAKILYRHNYFPPIYDNLEKINFLQDLTALSDVG